VHYTIEFGGELPGVRVRTGGAANRPGFMQLSDEIVDDPRFRPGTSILVDHSELDARPLSTNDLAAIGDHNVRLARRFGGAPIAIVAPSDLTFGLSRQAGGLSGCVGLRICTFRSHEAALAWLSYGVFVPLIGSSTVSVQSGSRHSHTSAGSLPTRGQHRFVSTHAREGLTSPSESNKSRFRGLS
jgi:hypothetical protein